ncbi:hypothetical protein BV20DRAFT_965781 [Pilatotrama ljubarskyi]|nr:hypothetical protein BV20DRAFT_965781 [Pilatotrama ljubarskyi]
MKATCGVLTQQLSSLTDQGKRVEELGPTMKAAESAIEGLRRQLAAQDETRAGVVESVKRTIRDDLKAKALEEMKKRIKTQIRAEVTKQVGEQLEKQIVPEHLPMSLEDHVKQGREQVTAMRAALENSKARRENATITEADTMKPLAVVFRSDGTKSDLYPANINSLFAYNDAKMSQLVHDYDLYDFKDIVKNFNAFLAHVGVVKFRRL